MPSRARIRRSRHPRGATTVAILGLLAALAIAGYLFAERHQAPPADTPEQKRAKIETAKNFATTQMDAMLAAYKKNTGHYPLSAEGVWALNEAPPRVAGWQGPYLTTQTMPIDPWGQIYQYTFPGTHNGPDKYDVWSVGPDQLSGTADDIGNW
ncbi:MAG: type II secretion system protein GspG [Gammaproteobacteria bacterium]